MAIAPHIMTFGEPYAAEDAAYNEEKKADHETSRKLRAERLRRELAQLEGNHGAA